MHSFMHACKIHACLIIANNVHVSFKRAPSSLQIVIVTFHKSTWESIWNVSPREKNIFIPAFRQCMHHPTLPPENNPSSLGGTKHNLITEQPPVSAAGLKYNHGPSWQPLFKIHSTSWKFPSFPYFTHCFLTQVISVCPWP